MAEALYNGRGETTQGQTYAAPWHGEASVTETLRAQTISIRRGRVSVPPSDIALLGRGPLATLTSTSSTNVVSEEHGAIERLQKLISELEGELAAARSELRSVKAASTIRMTRATDAYGLFVLAKIAAAGDGPTADEMAEVLHVPDGWMVVARLLAADLIGENVRRFFITDAGRELLYETGMDA